MPSKRYNLRKTKARITSSKLEKNSLIKKRKHNTWIGWISPSSTRNYMLNDLISDILMSKKYRINNITGKFDNKETHFLLEQGNAFERRVVELLKNKLLKTEYVDIEGNKLPRSYVLADKTLTSMKSGIPVIFSPIFHDFDNKWNGIPDILIRSDYLSKLFVKSPEIEKSGCAWNDDWHYLIIDIKFSTLRLRANGVELLNDENFKAYKAQLWMYNDILSRIQNYNPNKTFILGRNVKYNTYDECFVGEGCFYQLGIIDYKGWDKEYPNKTKQAIKWLKTVPSVTENFTIDTIIANKKWNLFPNMCVNNMWIQPQKQKIAEEINDITMLPYCGVKQREFALKNGILGWKDSACTAENLGFDVDSYRGRIVDSCLQVNKPTSDKKFIIKKSDVFPNYASLKSLKNKIYFDFETISNVCDDFSTLPEPSYTNLAFMVSFGYVKRHKFIIKTFVAQGLHLKFEKEMFDNVIKEIPIQDSTFIHWGTHDKTVWEFMEARYNIFCEPREWFNAHKAYENNAVGIRGCFSSSLKRVTNALNDTGHVKQRYIKDEDGMEAMHRAYVAQQESEGEVFIEHPYIKELKEYNIKDVKSLYEVTQFLENLKIN